MADPSDTRLGVADANPSPPGTGEYAAVMTPLVLTLIGDDRSGLVKVVASAVAHHGGNWERSQMAELSGKFAGIVLVTIPDDRVDSFNDAMTPLRGILEVTVQRAEPAGEESDVLRWKLELLGADRPGIVSEVTTVLDRHGVSINSLTTETREAPMAAEMLFQAVADLEMPRSTDIAALRAALENLANELMVDIDLDTAV